MLAYLQGFSATLNDHPFLLWAFAFVLGSCIASFINVVVWRFPIMLQDEWNQAAAEQLEVKAPKASGLTLSKPDSHCPNCKTPIAWYYNLPLLGWLVLRGQCAQCKTPISTRYPLVELTGGLLAALAVYGYGASTQGVFAAVLLLVLLTISLIDWDTQLIPDDIALPLLWAGLLINCAGVFVPLQDAVLGAALGYGLLWACFKTFKLITGKDGMGYGDFKLLAALGAWMGLESIGIIILIASITGASFGIGQRLTGKLQASQAMPFGPWLALGGAVYLIWGDALTKSLLAL